LASGTSPLRIGFTSGFVWVQVDGIGGDVRRNGFWTKPILIDIDFDQLDDGRFQHRRAAQLHSQGASIGVDDLVPWCGWIAEMIASGS
jgi:hypothetical protein